MSSTTEILKLGIEHDLGEFNLISRIGEEDLAVKRFDGYLIKLIQVAPYPKKTQRLEISDYLITLVVSQEPGI